MLGWTRALKGKNRLRGVFFWRLADNGYIGSNIYLWLVGGLVAGEKDVALSCEGLCLVWGIIAALAVRCWVTLSLVD